MLKISLKLILTATVSAGLCCMSNLQAQIVSAPPLSHAYQTRIASIARQALTDRDITKKQYRSTIAALHSNPCKGVDRALTEGQKAAMTPIIAAQEGGNAVELLKSFKLGTWQIIYLSNGVSDEPYLFYPDSPGKAKSLGAWSGAATIFETEEIRDWTIQNIPNIPKQLASCFAWHVTLNRD